MIYTFYSYKGGVGRSMAVANVGTWFALQGLRVVLVDWDLEAPGLETFFARSDDAIEAARSRAGIMDLVMDYEEIYPTLTGVGTSNGNATLGTLRNALPPITSVLQPLELPEGAVEGGQLRLLSAGCRTTKTLPHYASRVQSFSWSELYARYEGEAYFQWLREQLLAAADVTILDSRTGVTEMGGVCTRQLADVVVSFCAPNIQNLRGVAEMTRSFQRDEVLQARGMSLEVLVVPARIDTSEIALRKEFIQQYERLADVPARLKALERTFWDLRIPYIPKYAYGEERAVGRPDGAEELVKAYEDLGIHLAVLSREGSTVRTRLQHLIQKRFPQLVPAVLVTYAASDGRELAAHLRERIARAGLSVWEGVGNIEGEDVTRTAAVIEHIRHLVVVLSPAALASPTLRRYIAEARRLGIWLHAVSDGVSKLDPPGWLRSVTVHDLDRDWSSLQSLLGSRVPAARVPRMAPPIPDTYVQRPEAALRVKKALLGGSASNRAAKIAICGAGGTGKTSLAAALCCDADVTDHFDGGIAWLDLGPHDSLHDQLAKVYAAYSGEAAEFQSSKDALRAVSGAIGSRKALWVLDDAIRVDDVSTVSECLPQATILLITRNRQVAQAISASITLLGGMSVDEAVELLNAAAGVSIPTDQAREIAETLGHLPLAVRLAGAALKPTEEGDDSRRLALSSLAVEQLLDDRGVGALDISGSDRSLSVAATLHDVLSYLSRNERESLAEIAGRPDETVPEDVLIRELGEKLGEVEARSVLAGLRDRSLLGDVDGGLRVPRLLRRYLRQSGQRQSTGSARERARDILGGQAATIDDILKLADELKRESAFSYARRLLARTLVGSDFSRSPERTQLKLVQKLVLCTYKDTDLPARARLDRALDILAQYAGLDASIDPETLGLAGAIHKRKWEIDAQRTHLERSLAYYLRGHQSSDVASPDYDFGYTGINAAFVLDQLAYLEEKEARQAGTQSETATGRRMQATRIRETLCRDLPPQLDNRDRLWLRDNWWFFATLLEAYFGLSRYREARHWMARGRALPNVVDWEIESTARQLVALARLRDTEPKGGQAEAWGVIEELVGGDVEALRRLKAGKIGLALSGGGFRASLFHIGVLARLAELDVLRSVEVLSCVSGGSIIGAHYYLEVRKLLREKHDCDISRRDYLDIVRRIEVSFLAGVQTNLRTSVTANPGAVLRMIFSRRYTRTTRLGKLYESRLFSRIDDGEGRDTRYMDGLKIEPKGEAKDFRPDLHNWPRRAKVPILVLNAATLNTGHAWYFTSTYMGEPGTRVDPRIDGNDWLRTMYYDEAPTPYRHVGLGQAVAASSCVPGLFEPVVLDGLYPDRVVRLVDGGVYDNQGAAALVEQDCTLLLVSDASGQMQTLADPPNGLLGVALRANSMLQARLRLAQFQEVDELRKSSILRGLMFVHLKKDLEVEPVDWVKCEDPYDPADDARPPTRRGPLTSYGIRRDVQEKLAAIRTDLDSFSDLEAYALMTSGYRMTEYEFPRVVSDLPEGDRSREPWRFLRVEESMKARGGEREHARLMAVLDAGAHIAFKLWVLSNPLRRWIQRPWFRGTLIAGVGAAVAWIVRECVQSGLSLTGVFVVLAVIAVAVSIAGLIFRILFFALGWVASVVHMMFFDRFYLRRGRVARATAAPKPSSGGDGPDPQRVPA